ncbi:hypothetical protein BH23BAC3_BH23BAC3_28890 [soil metagenome]
MKLILTVFLFFTTIGTGLSQSVNAEFESDHQSNNSSEFPLKEGIVMVSQSSYQFGSADNQVSIITPIDFALSRDRTKLGAVRFDRSLNSEIYEYSGQQIIQRELEFVDATDETIMLSVLDNGEFIVRDNVANFTFFDAAGNEGYSLSNATQAPGGEQPSGLAWSSTGETVVLYNPVIQYDGARGSRVSVAVGDQETREIYNSSSSIINNLSVSENGSFITIGSPGSGESSRINLIDRFGNKLLDLELDMDVAGVSVTLDARYITVFSDNRVQVYRIADQELLGSSTSTIRIIHAAYQPEESTIISIGGLIRNGSVNNPEISAINLAQRQLDRHQLNGTISMLSQADISINRISAGTYRIEGINRPIEVSASF